MTENSSMTKLEAFKMLFEPEHGWANLEELNRSFAQFNAKRSGQPVEYCDFCGCAKEIAEPAPHGTCCVSCGFGWEEIAQAVRIVNGLAKLFWPEMVPFGKAELAPCGELRRKAMDLVLGETVPE